MANNEWKSHPCEKYLFNSSPWISQASAERGQFRTTVSSI